jgi:hypothetical protein
MNAVNLIPKDGRSRRGDGFRVSPPTLAIIGGLVVALVATVLYVTTANTVATRKSQLAQVTAGVAGWTAAANSYTSFVHLAAERTQQLADVRQLAAARFPWSDLLGQIGGVMPRAAALSSLTAASTASSGAGAAAAVPSVQLSGCAASQSVVAQTMVQLGTVKGVSGVNLSSSSESGGSSSSTTAGSGSGGCTFPVQFQLTLNFTASSATPAAAAGATSSTGTPATTTPAAPANTTSTPAATPSASATTTPTPVSAS